MIRTLMVLMGLVMLVGLSACGGQESLDVVGSVVQDAPLPSEEKVVKRTGPAING